jgi:hypothetical protein
MEALIDDAAHDREQALKHDAREAGAGRPRRLLRSGGIRAP